MHPDGWWALLPVPVMAILSWRLRAVTVDGAIAGLGVGLLLSWGLGWAGFAILLTMVGLGTVLSERSGRSRDAWQVLCNGGVAAAFGVFGAGAAAAGALGAALSDTTSSELGRRFGGTPRRLLFGDPVQAGADGGMSLAATVLGVLFSWPVPLVAWALGAIPDFAVASGVAAAAMTGNLVDSVLGAAVQRRLGRRGNDLVNAAATTTGALVALLVS